MKKLSVAIIAACLALAAGLNAAETKKQAYTRLVKEGETLVAAKQYAQSIEKYKEAIALVPDQSLAHLELAEVYEISELYELAKQEFTEALGISKKSYEAYTGLGKLYLKLGMNSQAMECFRTAMTIKGTNSLYRLIAACAKNLGENDLAVAMLKNVVAAEHQYDDLVALGSLYGEQKLSKEAEDMFSQAIKLDKDRNEAYFHLGVLYLQDRDLAKAEQIFRIVLERAPDDALAHFFLGNIYYQQKKVQQARDEARKAKEFSKSPMLTLYSSKFDDLLAKEPRR